MTDDGGPVGNGRRKDAAGGSRRTWLLLGAAFCVFWVFYMSLFGPGPRSPRLDDRGARSKASYGWTLLDLKDEPAPFAQFRGKAVFLNIWATWCAPCVREMPSIARLAEEPRLKDKGIAFVCVATDESAADVRRFLEGKSWPMRFYRAESVPGVFASEGIPITFIIAPDGRIVSTEEAPPTGTRPRSSRCSRSSPTRPGPPARLETVRQKRS